ncbi:MAG: TolC family protein, partial [Pseudomonadota bacterium]
MSFFKYLRFRSFLGLMTLLPFFIVLTCLSSEGAETASKDHTAPQQSQKEPVGEQREPLPVMAQSKLNQGIINTNKVNIRRAPGLGEEIVGIIKEKGGVVEVLSRDGDWIEIEAKSGKGWIHSRYITMMKEKETSEMDPKQVVSTGSPMSEAASSELPKSDDLILPGLPEGPPLPTLRLSLKEAVAAALEKNHDIIVEKFSPLIAETEIQKERGAFDPSLSSSITNDRSRSLDTSKVDGIADISDRDMDSFSEKYKAATEISKKFEPGTKLALVYEVTDAVEPKPIDKPHWGTNTALTLKLTQSLLKNFGTDINLAKVWIAEKATEQSHADFVKRVVDTVAEVQGAYWDLYKNRKTLDIRRESYHLTKDLLEKKKIEARLGAIASLDLVEIESDVASRITDFIEAQKTLRESEVKFKTLLDLPLNFEGKPVQIEPANSPKFEVVKVVFKESLDLALEKNPEYQKLKSQEEAKGIEMEYYRNQTLPDLELSVGYGLKKVHEDLSRSMGVYGARGDGAGLDRNNYELGLKLTYPLGNNTAEADYTKRKLELKKIGAQLKKQEVTL